MRAAGALVLVITMSAASCAGPDVSDVEPTEIPEREAYREWIRIEPPGTVCGDGSQYKFWVNFSDVSNDVVVAFEPGGGCWDFDSCTGRAGIRGAANVDGLPDDHIEQTGFIVPFFKRDYETNHTRDWNYVYVPYCTGDVHAGNAVTTYEDPRGEEPPIEFHHTGHANVQAVLDYMVEHFPTVPRLLVTGCSAGGAGSTINYHWMRSQLPGVERSYLLADSGPIFPSDGFSGPLHEKVYEAWGVGPLLEDLPAPFDVDDFGSLNRMLAETYPDDRMAVTYFQRDLNYSLYSYERFYEPTPAKEEVLTMWAEDTEALRAIYDEHDNLGYYLPYWRALNDSHCTTLIRYAGSEIEEQGMTLGAYVTELLDDGVPLGSYLESAQPGEDE